MNPLNMTAIALIIAGGLGLAYDSSSYAQEMPEDRLVLVEMTLQYPQTAGITVWVGIAAIVAGTLMLVMPKDI